MRGIVSLLDQMHTELVDDLWMDMVAACSVTNKHLPPLPHFSWHVFEDCDIGGLAQVLADIAKKTTPFTVRTSGLGVFTGSQPIVYVALIKDERLMRFQEMIWHKTAAYTKKISPFYIPDFWIPHITLINGTNEKNNLLCALNKLLTKNCVWEFKVDTLAMIGDPTSEGLRQKHMFEFVSG